MSVQSQIELESCVSTQMTALDGRKFEEIHAAMTMNQHYVFAAQDPEATGEL